MDQGADEEEEKEEDEQGVKGEEEAPFSQIFFLRKYYGKVLDNQILKNFHIVCLQKYEGVFDF